MAQDGQIVIGTKIEDTGFNKGINKLKGSVSTGIGKIGSTVTTGIGAASAAVTAFGGYSLKAGSDFEAGMSKVGAISGANEEQLDKLTEKAKEMGAKTKFSATESADAFSYMAMAGWKTEDMLNGIEGVMNLAAASGEDLATTSDIVTDAMTAFGLSANQSSHFADVLATASSNANTNVGLMGETFKYIAPVAGALGYSIEDTSVAIGLMANSGIKASQAGTSLRELLTNLARPSKTVSAAMDELGISLTDNQGNMKSLDTLMGDLRKSFDGLTEKEKATNAAALAGKTGMSGLLAIVNSSDKDFNKLSEAIAHSSDGMGDASKMAEQMQDNLQGAVTIAKSAIEGLGIQMYESFGDKAKDFIQSGTEIIANITEGLKTGDKGAIEKGVSDMLNLIVSTIIKYSPTVMKLGVYLLLLLSKALIKNLPTLVIGIRDLFVELAPQLIEEGKKLFSKLGGGFESGLPALLEKALPLLVKFSATLREKAGLLVDAGLKLILKLAQGIANSLPVLIKYIPTIISNIAGIINDNAPKLLITAVKIIITLAKGMVKAIPVLVKNLPKIIKAIVDVFFAFNWVAMGKNLITMIANGIKNMGPSLATAGKNLLAKLLSVFKSGIKNIVTSFKAIPTNVLSVFKNLPSQMVGVGKNVVLGLIKGIKGNAKNIVKVAGGLGNSLVDSVKKKLGIHSPSKVFAQLGDYCIKGFEQPFKGYNPTDIMASTLDKSMTSAKALGNSLGSSVVDSGAGASNNVELNFYDATPTPDGVYRKFNQTMRYGLAGLI